MNSQGQRKSKIIKEWIIFSLCLGLGGHMALGLVLHAPEVWPLNTVWVYGLLMAMSFYVVVQLARSIWWFFRAGSTLSESPQRDLF